MELIHSFFEVRVLQLYDQVKLGWFRQWHCFFNFWSEEMSLSPDGTEALQLFSKYINFASINGR